MSKIGILSSQFRTDLSPNFRASSKLVDFPSKKETRARQITDVSIGVNDKEVGIENAEHKALKQACKTWIKKVKKLKKVENDEYEAFKDYDRPTKPNLVNEVEDPEHCDKRI
ncbi:13757_t:CDS:2 [Dentiscutata erythropus]|uniref:13757_t:CDS:1 n=1 Tax=Dentiscutata erythropus TaxID=1348616 RepID=A0A9N9NL07_9GLOM|nr:13757_t:CDS:2 [Dentiscutata erythropus]